jgi:hypothetical protein
VPSSLLTQWDVYRHPKVNWTPHESQCEVLESQARHKVWCAGRRTGKSELGGHILLPPSFSARFLADEWKRKRKRREYWIVGDEYVTADKEFRVIWNLIKYLGIPMDKGSHHSIDGKDQSVISLWNNQFLIITQSAKYPDNLVGEALFGVLMVEAAKTKPSIWMKHVRPMLNDNEGWSIHTSTPEGKNHFYDKFEMGQDPEYPDWESWRMPAWRNPYVYTQTGRMNSRTGQNLPIPPEEITVDDDVWFLLEQLENSRTASPYAIAEQYGLNIDNEILADASELTIELFKQEVAADFTEFVGQVFKDYDEEYHVDSLEYHPGWETYAAVDYGFTNPNVWLLIQVGPWQEINVLAEVYEPNLTADQFADEIIRRKTRHGVPFNPPELRIFYPDPADPMSSKTLSDRLKATAAGGTGGELNIRINLIRQALRKGRIDYAATGLTEGNADKWRPQLMIDRSCTGLRADMLAYRYPERKEDAETSRDRFELPLKRDDHGPEALGRFFVGRFGPGSLTPSGGTRIRRANLGRHASHKQRNRPMQKPISAMRPTKSGYPEWKDEEFRRDYR